MENKFKVGDLVNLPPSHGAFIGTVAEIDGDSVRIRWNGGELVSSCIGDWVKTDILRLRRRGRS